MARQRFPFPMLFLALTSPSKLDRWRQYLTLLLLVAIPAVGVTACAPRDLSKNRVEIKRTLDDFAPSPPELSPRGEEGEKRDRDRIDNAIRMTTKMLHLSASEQDQWSAYIQRGGLYFERGDYEGAVADLEKGIELGEEKKRSDKQKPGFAGYGHEFDRTLHDGYKRLGASYYALGDHARAKKMYTHVIENRPTDGEAYDYLGLLLESQGDYTSAISAYSTGIEKAAYDKLYYDRGCAYANIGDLDKALADFWRVTDGRSPLAIQAHFHEARVLEKQARKSEALAAYRKVVAMITRGVPVDRFARARPAILTQALDKIQELERP